MILAVIYGIFIRLFFKKSNLSKNMARQVTLQTTNKEHRTTKAFKKLVTL